MKEADLSLEENAFYYAGVNEKAAVSEEAWAGLVGHDLHSFSQDTGL